jgi:hypothetical protein
MIGRTLTGALIALTIAASPALACKGEEIFSDDFADESGPWDQTQFSKIGGGHAELSMQPGYMGVVRLLADTPKEFDVCVDLTYPEVKNPDGGTTGGLAFWFKDYQNFFGVGTTPFGAAGAWRYNKEKYLRLSPFRKYEALKAGTGQTNTLRITAKGNQITFYANDQKLGSFRGVPEEAYIGLYATSATDETQNVWKFTNFKLTQPPEQ